MPEAPPIAPLITFVVQCYNTEQYVAECVNSIIAQGDTFPWEVIAVDDFSSDRTLEILFSFHDPRIRVISHSVNTGSQACVWEAMHSARGQLIARIDSDDRYRNNFLQHIVPIFREHPDVGMVYGDAAIMDSQGWIVAPHSSRRYPGSPNGNDFLALLEENFICAPTVIARREAWLRCLPIPDQMTLGDWYFNVLTARKYRTYHIDSVVADYRVHSGNLHSKIVADGRDEASVMWLLEHVFSSKEEDPDLERKKQRARARIHCAQYKTLADKYFGLRMNADARRCYLKAFRYGPRSLVSPALVRRFAATFMRRTWYDNTKRVLRNFSRAVA